MHTQVHPTRSNGRRLAAFASSKEAHRKPSYDCRELPDAVRIVVYVPGVDATGVEIEARGPDLLIHARKAHFVRVNWQALHLEGSQRDYQLRLRLGLNFEFTEMQADIHDGVLTVTVPKSQGVLAEDSRWRDVA